MFSLTVNERNHIWLSPACQQVPAALTPLAGVASRRLLGAKPTTARFVSPVPGVRGPFSRFLTEARAELAVRQISGWPLAHRLSRNLNPSESVDRGPSVCLQSSLRRLPG